MRFGRYFSKIARNRYSCRSFKIKPVEKKKIEEILHTARVAPSARNSQPWFVFVIREEKMKDEVSSCYSRNWLKGAPVLIVICGNHSKSWKRTDGKDHCDIDIGIFTDHITLAATDAGLATCWICKFDTKKCAEILNLPPHVEPMALLPLGYPRDKVNKKRHTTQRLTVGDITSWEHF